MKAGTKQFAKLMMALVAACLVTVCLMLAACGGSGTSSAASSSDSGSASASSASTSSSAADPTAKFVGTWQIAAAEMQGLTISGNFGDMLDVQDGITLIIATDGTGSMGMGEEATILTWAADGPDSIYATIQSETEFTTQQAIPITYKDGALFMPIGQDGQQASIIFTADGNYADAKQISLDSAKPITSEAELLGTWKLSGLNMGGASMYGDAQALAAAMGGQESWIAFKEGGVAEMESGEGAWAVGDDGATLTTTDIMGTNTVPIVSLGDEIAIDYSAVIDYSASTGHDFIMVMSRA